MARRLLPRQPFAWGPLPTHSTLDKSATRRLGIIAVSVSLVAGVLLVLCLYIFVKCRQERHKKRQAIKVSRR